MYDHLLLLAKTTTKISGFIYSFDNNNLNYWEYYLPEKKNPEFISHL